MVCSPRSGGRRWLTLDSATRRRSSPTLRPPRCATGSVRRRPPRWRNRLRGFLMLRTVEATIDSDGTVNLLESVRLTGVRRALVTIMDEEPQVDDTALL